MKQALWFFLVLGIGIVQISIAAETTYQSNNALSDTVANNSASEEYTYKYTNEEISRAIDNLSAYAKQKEYKKEYQKVLERQRELAKKPNVRIGMSASQVLHNSNWGKPDDINTTINTYGKFEQWI